MNAHVQQLLEQVNKLNEEDRESFIEALFEDEEERDDEIAGPDENTAALIAERLRQIDSGEVKCTPWEVVRARLLGVDDAPPAN